MHRSPDSRPVRARRLTTRSGRRSYLKLILAPALVGAFALSAGAPGVAEGGTDASVSLPLTSYLELLHSAGAAPPEGPPVDFVIREAFWDVTVDTGEGARIEAHVWIEVLREGWSRVPVLPADIAAEWVRVDGKPATLHFDPGTRPTVILSRPGKYEVTARLRVPLDESLGGRGFDFDLPASAITRVRVRVPEPGQEWVVTPSGATVLSEHLPSESVLVALLPPGTGSFDVEWHEAPPVDADAETRLVAESATRFHFGEAVLRATARVRLNVSRAPMSSVLLSLPAEVENVSVSGDIVLGQSEEADAGRLKVTVPFHHPLSGTADLDVTWEIPLDPKRASVVLGGLQVGGATRDTGTLSLSTVATLELSAPNDEAKGTKPIDPSELPDWAPTPTEGDPLLFAFKYHGHPHLVTTHIVRHADTEMLTTSVEKLELVTVVTREGKTVTRALLRVTNNLKQFLRVELPEEHVLWSAFVGDRPVKPAHDESGALLVPLLRSSWSDGVLLPFTVELVYFGESSPLDGLVGRGELIAPRTDVPVTRMTWDLVLPPERSYLHVGGDLRTLEEDRGVRDSGLLALGTPVSGKGSARARRPEVAEKNLEEDRSGWGPDPAEPAMKLPAGTAASTTSPAYLSGAEAGAGDEIYHRGEEGRRTGLYALRGATAGEATVADALAVDGRLALAPGAPLVKGVLPVRVHLPISADARVVRMEKELVEAGEGSAVTFTWLDSDVRNVMGSATWPLLLVLGLAFAAHLFEALRRRRFVVLAPMALVGGSAAMLLGAVHFGADLPLPSWQGPTSAAVLAYVAWAAWTRRLRVPAFATRAWARFAPGEQTRPPEPTPTPPAQVVNPMITVEITESHPQSSAPAGATPDTEES